MAKAKTSTEVLEAAKWILQNVGWCQKQFTKYSKDGKKVVGVCATQAIYSVEIENNDEARRNDARFRLERVIGNDIIGFNDRRTTKKRDVIRAFSKAIQEK